jgi:hypothetical protein
MEEVAGVSKRNGIGSAVYFSLPWWWKQRSRKERTITNEPSRAIQLTWRKLTLFVWHKTQFVVFYEQSRGKAKIE